ncbi:MAG: hypothetical protein GY859_14595 [Desulfobacterales bacterium]|nr:hypothetical protein [Desulfobacterales bacterium]
MKKPNFRIIAATNRDLAERVEKGVMREDFYYRVHVIPIHLPPLRGRKEDIPLLMEHFMKAYDRKLRPRVTPAVMDSLLEYDWPGNVRELQNVLYRFVTLKRIDFHGRPPAVKPNHNPPPEMDPARVYFRDAVEGFEKDFLIRALEQNRWNRTRTAKALGIGLRTMQRKMKTYDIS